MSVASNIRQLRNASGMTQAELARKIGAARSTVTQWESGYSAPRMGMVQKLAWAFNVSTADIVAERNDAPGELTETEMLLLSYFRECTPSRKQRLLDDARDHAGMSKEEQVAVESSLSEKAV